MESTATRGAGTGPTADGTRVVAPPTEDAAAETATDGATTEAGTGAAPARGATTEATAHGTWRADVRAF
eukprot:3591432-Pleurochrysis_carterae.AAC.1